MSELKLEIKNIKNIQRADVTIPVEKGVYCLVGANGVGKSTVLSCLAQTVFKSSLKTLNEEDFDAATSSVAFTYKNGTTIWKCNNNIWTSTSSNEEIHFNGMYEGSLFYGTRFADSISVDQLFKDGKIKNSDIVDADDYIKENLSYILHGNYNYYKNLKRIRNKKIAHELRFKNTPYFIEVRNNHLISQYRMSSGECLLISLLHFIYNALIRRSLPTDQPILMLVDEIELALHPVAVKRFIALLNELIKNHENLTIVLTTHSPEVIHEIRPSNIYMLEHSSKDNSIRVVNPCYPSYAIRDVYMHDGFDYVILVEDLLAKYLIETSIKSLGLGSSRLINVLPVGGWENVLRFHKEALMTNTFGTGTAVLSILDGDVKEIVKKEYKSLPKLYLPIGSIEKHLRKVIIDDEIPNERKEINDTFFNVDSIDTIIADYYKDGSRDDNNGKILYDKLIQDLNKRHIDEQIFVKELCTIIRKYVDFTSFEESLKKKIEDSIH